MPFFSPRLCAAIFFGTLKPEPQMESHLEVNSRLKLERR